MFKPVWVKPLADYKIQVRFADGVEGVVSLDHLVGKGVFKAWEDDIDICPDTLYFEITNIDPEEYFTQHQKLAMGKTEGWSTH